MATFARRRLVELILLANAGAFAVLLAELVILDHFDGFQLVAPVAATTGLVVSLLAVLLRGRLRMLMAAPLVLVALAGMVGVIRHLDERDADLALLAVPVASAHDGEDHDDDSGSGDDGEDDDDHDHEPPPLAPIGLSGSAMLGALAAIAGGAPAGRDT